MERLRKNHLHLWKTFRKAREDPTPLEEWRPVRVPGVEEPELLQSGPAGAEGFHERLTPTSGVYPGKRGHASWPDTDSPAGV
jgi:hypothetical protein